MSEKLLEYFKTIRGFNEWWNNLKLPTKNKIIYDLDLIILQETSRLMQPRELSIEEKKEAIRRCFGD